MKLSRRHFLTSAAVGAAALATGCATTPNASTPIAAADAKPVRFAHLADIHVMPERGAHRGLEKCLAAVHALEPRPQFMLTGGDLVHDARSADPQRARALYDLFNRVARDSDIPFRHCIGNHDCVGWGARSPVDPNHVDYGKKLFQEKLHIDALNYAYDFGGWRICVIDNILPTNFDGERGYQGGFSEQAVDFVERDFTAHAERPKLICTHIPIVSATAMTYSEDVEGKERPLATSLVTRNSKQILALLRKHRVELLLTGHLHQSERLRYQHTTHIAQGAVCGSWWKGPNAETPEGFGIIDLWPDGRWEHRYHAYGWDVVE